MIDKMTEDFDILRIAELNHRNSISDKGNYPNFDDDKICNKDMQMNQLEKALPSQESIREMKVYKRRFYILGLFSFIVFSNFIIWGTFGPIMHSSKFAFNWTDGYIALLEDWGYTVTVMFTIPLSLFTNRYGLRKGVLLTIGLMTIGAASRCITMDDFAFTYLASFAAIIVGAASCLTQSLPALISSTWFPPTERTTATAFSVMVSQLSSTVMYLSPLIVRSPPHGFDDDEDYEVTTTNSLEEFISTEGPAASIDISPNSSIVVDVHNGTKGPSYELIATATPLDDLISTIASVEDSLTRDEVKSDIHHLMYIHFGMCAFALLCAVAYFPDKPPHPPSKSQTEERIDYKKSLKMIFRNRDFFMGMIAFISLNTFPVIWFSVMNFSLKCIGISQDQTMHIAIIASLVAAATSLVTARLTDYLQGHMKGIAIGLVITASSFFVWFLLITEGVIVPSSNLQVFLSVILGIASSYAALPILFELMVELAYPCGEGFVGALMVFFNDSTGMVFLLVMMIPSKCYRWLSYMLVVTIVGTLIPLFIAKEDRKRTAVDNQLDTVASTANIIQT